MNEPKSILHSLMAIIEDRKRNPPARSYTTTLFQGGVDQIGAKVTEEAAELIEAARESSPEARTHLVHEAADLIYHVLVLLGYREVTLDEVEAELSRRQGISGLDEKESRGKV